MNEFWKSDTYQIVKAMKATGNRPGVIAQWKELVENWAEQSNSPDAASVRAWLPMWQVRPFYTAAELAPIFPTLAMVLGLSKGLGRLSPQKSPQRLENELRMASLPVRQLFGAGTALYFAVERLHYWGQAPREEWLREIRNA